MERAHRITGRPIGQGEYGHGRCRPFSEMEAEMTVSGPHRIGSKCRKAIYREYTDATFAQLQRGERARPGDWWTYLTEARRWLLLARLRCTTQIWRRSTRRARRMACPGRRSAERPSWRNR